MADQIIPSLLHRPRRLRRTPLLRDMVRETSLEVTDFIYPLFVKEAGGPKEPIPSMPGQYRLSLEDLIEEAQEVRELRIPAVLLFGIPLKKDPLGSQAYAEDGIIQRACRLLKREVPDLVVITDVCLCEYTSHGHCGQLDEKGYVMNDPTLELLAKTALSQAQAGADIVAPSDMMDGRVGYIRQVLDREGFSHIPIMAYSAKFASAFYGPFREAAASAPAFGDRKQYQMDPGNRREALREVRFDLEEGADFVMVKPALAYLDVICQVRQLFDVPLVAYNVSGEYSMVKAAALQGWIEEKRIVMEILTGIKRAGADLIITYHAKEVARWLREGEV